ncbi:DUF2911 domain-containing protein [Chitinophagaceae bacterium LB-8]|uniref:DUF2911 domain-containing protein n=1 Tax=Paraflavisolibacter caeni TaxID=2982496 RepID=A0A9X2XPC4_9BACT|nr:DUF2911 domain-containing protein [Paraflavisolibacter caeni]MCU7550529.1 DUF2911 domain-containing protein [Paraflavisolibacter caeni]
MKNVFSTLFLFSLGILFSLSACAQDQQNRPSPAAKSTGKAGGANITIAYSSPAVKGRTIWGELVPYGKVWRAGANEATTFETDKDVKVEGKTLPAGKYAFFVIPNEKEWTVIFNKTASQWGAFKYDEKQDALRVAVKPEKSKEFNERLKYVVEKDGIELMWENLEVPVHVK